MIISYFVHFGLKKWVKAVQETY